MRIRQFLIPTQGSAQPRVPKRHGERRVVARRRCSADVAGSLAALLDLLPRQVLAGLAGARAVLKPSFNSADPYPATSDPGFVRLLERELRSRGAAAVELVESTGMANASDAATTAAALGLAPGTVVSLDHGPWRAVRIAGSPLRTVRVAARVLEAEYLVYLVCLKTHRHARFSLAVKAGMGVIHPLDRLRIHLFRLEERLADVNLAVQPDLVIVDARRAMVTGGPEQGEVRDVGWLLASSDPVALDVECLKILRAIPAENRLDRPPWELPQIARAVAMGWGSRSEEDYEVRGDPR
jgi:uncharacterized protein (DUF362 family)